MAMKKKNYSPEKARKRLKELASRSSAKVPNWFLSVVVKGDKERHEAILLGISGPASECVTLDPESDEFAAIAKKYETAP